MPSPLSRDVSGRALMGLAPVVFLDRSSLRGRWRGVGASGDVGSFLTIIFGGTPGSRRDLKSGKLVQAM